MAKYTAKDIWSLTKSTVGQFMENNSFRLAAALAYNTIFSLPPLLLIIISAAGAIWGQEAFSGELETQMSGILGEESAKELQTMIQNVNKSGSGGIASAVGIATLIFGATTFFITLQDSLNTIWNIKVNPKNGILKMAKDRFLSFGIILSVALLLLVSFVVSAALSFFGGYLERLLPDVAVIFLYILNIVVSLGVITCLFALIYKYLPDAIIRWKDVWVGSFLTALLFVLGKFLISYYMGTTNPGSAYGAAGSIIIILVWIYYSSLILFFGAEFTQQYAAMFGQQIRPQENAVKIQIAEVTHEETDDHLAGRPKAVGRFRKK